MLFVKEHCDGQISKQTHEETVILAKTRAASERAKEAKEMSKSQKVTVKKMIIEMQQELDVCEKEYIQKLSEMVQLGLYKRARKLIREKDERV